MADYETTAYELVEQLKTKHNVELMDMQKYITEKFYNEHRWKKNIIELRKQEQVYFSLKDYEKAEQVKILCSHLEKEEVDNMQEELQVKLSKEETALFKR